MKSLLSQIINISENIYDYQHIKIFKIITPFNTNVLKTKCISNFKLIIQHLTVEIHTIIYCLQTFLFPGMEHKRLT